ncbi:sulfite exporter TauE/SafE family protein [uncultured Enterococcus sp.]|uniref:sulfite exporter TauE/SafE family protein n=1 Tax=uncultured Enterococcus sp. TaxID=167972 RepID=UPI0025DB1C38|nr:sulfite exporter TauE/SafE family protein [uncultured Enterococcus sp.]
MIALFLLSGILAGILGAILGLGGGIIVTPFLTLALGIDIKYAIGASVISVIATSSGASIAYLKDDLLNLRVAMFLEIATTLGAIVGALLTGLFAPNILYMFFGSLLVFSAYNMVKKLIGRKKETIFQGTVSPVVEKLQLNGAYYDKQEKRMISYQLTNLTGGFSMMFGAGIASGLLGIGSGAFKVLAMDTIMKMPLKPSSATSNLMMGVTAAASAMIYLFNGSIQPMIAAPLAIGVLIGSTIGTRIMQYLKTRTIRIIFVPILLYLGIQMIIKGFGGIG